MFEIRRPIRCLVNRAARRLARSGFRDARYSWRPPRNALDDILLRIFPDLRGLTFIQVGANDGRLVDPLVDYIEMFNWTGLMIEPLPQYFASLRRLHGDNPRLQLKQAAVDATTGPRLIYDVRSSGPELPDWVHGLASFDQARIEQVLQELGLPRTCMHEEEIETIDWATVWRLFPAPRCDLLAIDTEGYDITLLRLADLPHRRPRVVHFEHSCVSNDERFAFYRELAEWGYEIASDGPDTTAWLREPEKECAASAPPR